MRNARFYYQADVSTFLASDPDAILGIMMRQDAFSSLKLTMRDSWKEEISILKESLHDFDDGLMIFEYSIPRLGKRIDTVLLLGSVANNQKESEKKNHHESDTTKVEVKQPNLPRFLLSKLHEV